MDEKDIQSFETTLATEGAKAITEVGKNIAEDLTRPTSKSIGDNLGLLVDGVFGWLGLWGEKQKIKQQQNLEEFKNEINSNIESIPTDKLKEPTMYVVGPAIEASKFYFEEKHYKEMFAKLISATCDERYSDKISPYFVDAIKQLSPKDATLISNFTQKNELPIVNYILKTKDGHQNKYLNYVFYPNEPLQNANEHSSSLINLERLGLIKIDFQKWLADDSYYNKYQSDYHFTQKREELLKYVDQPQSRYKDLELEKGIIELTPLGKDFINLCL